MKSYTNLEQSKKLADILPIESADMWWPYYYDIISDTGEYDKEPMFHKPVCDPDKALPCWSLAALLSVFSLPMLRLDEQEDGERGWYVCHYTDDTRYDSYYRDEPIDACYNLILKLKEKDLLQC